MTTSEKFVHMAIAVLLFYGVMAAILLLTQRLRSRKGERVQAAAFLGPSLLLIAIGLLYPAGVTVYQSFFGAATFYPPFVGLDNYADLFTNSQQLQVLRNTLLWVLLTPTIATIIGLVYGIAMFVGAGLEATLWGLGLTLAGLPIRWLSRRFSSPSTSPAAATAPAAPRE